MTETAVCRSWIHQIGESQLLDVAQPLKIRMRDNVENNLILDGEEAIDGVVDDFPFVGHNSPIALMVLLLGKQTSMLGQQLLKLGDISHFDALERAALAEGIHSNVG